MFLKNKQEEEMQAVKEGKNEIFNSAGYRRRGELRSAVRLKLLSPGSVQFEVVTQRNIVVGTVMREP